MNAFKGWRAQFWIAILGLLIADIADAARSKLTPRQQLLISRYIEEAAAKHHLEPALLRAIIRVESAYNYEAISRVGARGLMQIMPHTARSMKAEKALDFTKPKYNILAGAELLRKLINRYQGKVKLALAAYNAGPTAVAKYGGIPPYKETQAYVKKVLRYLDKERSTSLNRGHP